MSEGQRGCLKPQKLTMHFHATSQALSSKVQPASAYDVSKFFQAVQQPT